MSKEFEKEIKEEIIERLLLTWKTVHQPTKLVILNRLFSARCKRNGTPLREVLKKMAKARDIVLALHTKTGAIFYVAAETQKMFKDQGASAQIYLERLIEDGDL